MKNFIFPYYVSFGKNDNYDSSIECSLSEKMAKRLVESAREGGRYNLLEDKDIFDIYDKVLKAIEKVETEAVERDLPIGITYPKELQYLEQTFTKKVSQSVCDSVIIDRDSSTNYLNNKDNSNNIIYTDNGATLLYVPYDYRGKLTIPSTVRVIERNAVSDRRNITEIIIEDGIECITEMTFRECVRLTKVIIPASVKRIDSDAFNQCKKLKEVVLTDGIEEIYPTAFRMCSDLTELHFPKTMVSVSTWALAYFNGLKDLYFHGMNTKIYDFDKYPWRVTMHVLSGSEAEKFAKSNKQSYILISENR